MDVPHAGSFLPPLFFGGVQWLPRAIILALVLGLPCLPFYVRILVVCGQPTDVEGLGGKSHEGRHADHKYSCNNTECVRVMNVQ